MQGSELEALIQAGIPGAEVIVKGEGDHFEAIVISEQFEGRSMVQQHQLVYGTLGDRLRVKFMRWPCIPIRPKTGPVSDASSKSNTSGQINHHWREVPARRDPHFRRQERRVADHGGDPAG